MVTRFKGKLVKTVKDVNGRFEDYSVFPKIGKFCCIGEWIISKWFVIIFFCSHKNDLLLV